MNLQVVKLFKPCSCLQWLLPIMLVLLKFFCQIISVDAKSLVTSFNISGVPFQTSGFHQPRHEPWSYCPSVLDEISGISRFCSSIMATFSFWVMSPSWNAYLSNTASWRFIFKLPDVMLQILVIHQLRLKLHLADRCSISLLPSNPSMHMHA